jgi:hypothetical protein
MSSPSLRFSELGARTLVPFPATAVPARVLWCNFELARQAGFAVPRQNHLSRRLERQLVEAFSLRALQPGEAAGSRRLVTLHADRYFGSGMGDHLGSARSGILLSRNVLLKGIGRTPLAREGQPRHGDGELQLVHAIAEALYGELAARLFSTGAARVLAILDQGMTARVDGRVRRAAVIARVGAPHRPAHLVRRLDEDLTDLPRLFTRLARHSGVLVTAAGRPHFADTMRRILRLHARVAAEQIRWRVLHGALSTSNMGLFGEMIDIWLMTTQDRTAPIHATRLRYRDLIFGREHLARAVNLHAMFLSVIETLTPRQRKDFGVEGLDCVKEFRKFYQQELAIQLLEAAGFDEPLARRLQGSHPKIVRRYVHVLTRLMALQNPGLLDARKVTARRIGVVDVFRLLSLLPGWHLRPSAPHDSVRRLARIQVSGSAGRRRRARALACRDLDRLTKIYAEIMAAARLAVADDSRTWRETCDAICSRAERAYIPLHTYRRARLVPRISRLVRRYAEAGRRFPRAVQALIDGVLSRGGVGAPPAHDQRAERKDVRRHAEFR